jgi:hypothetical protein
MAGTLRVLPEYVEGLLATSFALASRGEFNPLVAHITVAPARVYFDIAPDPSLPAELVVEPTVIPSKATTIRNITWNHWGERVASGKATVDQNICRPACGADHSVTGSARLTVFDLHKDSGRLLYGCLHVDFTPTGPLDRESAKWVTPNYLHRDQINWMTASLGGRDDGSWSWRSCPKQPPPSG